MESVEDWFKISIEVKWDGGGVGKWNVQDSLKYYPKYRANALHLTEHYRQVQFISEITTSQEVHRIWEN